MKKEYRFEFCLVDFQERNLYENIESDKIKKAAREKLKNGKDENGILFSNENYADKVELCLVDEYEIVVEDGRTFVQKKKPK